MMDAALDVTGNLVSRLILLRPLSLLRRYCKLWRIRTCLAMLHPFAVRLCLHTPIAILLLCLDLTFVLCSVDTQSLPPITWFNAAWKPEAARHVKTTASIMVATVQWTAFLQSCRADTRVVRYCTVGKAMCHLFANFLAYCKLVF